jgi:hypothetical protein
VAAQREQACADRAGDALRAAFDRIGVRRTTASGSTEPSSLRPFAVRMLLRVASSWM